MNSPAPAKTLAARRPDRKRRIAPFAALEDLHQLVIEAEALTVAAKKSSNLPSSASEDHDRAVRRLIVYIDLLHSLLTRTLTELERTIGLDGRT